MLLSKIILWMFALDHYLYARWMSVHLRNLLTLEVECPAVHFSVRLFPVGIIEGLHVPREANKPTPTKGQHNSASSRDQCCVNVSLATVERSYCMVRSGYYCLKELF